MSKVFLSVAIPSYDEMANLQKGVLEKVKNYLKKQKYSYEVIIVDDGSSDGSVDFLEDFTKENKHFRLIKNSHLGKAGAVTAGILAAKGEYVLFTDMDQATPIEEVEKLLPFFQENYDIVIGSRNSIRRGAPWSRRLMSRGWMLLRNSIINIKGITDTQCGFKMFRQEAAKRLFSVMRDFHHGYHAISGSNVTAGFDVELLYIAQKLGYSIKEVPVTWLYVETRRVNPLYDSLEGLSELIRIKQNDMGGKYEHL